MTLVRTRGHREQVTRAQPEAETGALVPQDDENTPRTPESDSELVANDIRTLLEQVAGTSAQEIDRVIAELHFLRQSLQSDSERIQKEITEYASLSQSTMQSTKIIAENLANLRSERSIRIADLHVEARLGPQERFRITTGLRPDGGPASRE